MTIKKVKGNILRCREGVIVHGCNAMGRFNKGLAKYIREYYPQVYKDYMTAFHNGEAKPGDIIVTRVRSQLFIVSAIIQKYYGNNPDVVYADYKAIQSCFEKVNHIEGTGNLPIIFPSIGAGLANGDWSTIEDIIKHSVAPHRKLIHVVQEKV